MSLQPLCERSMRTGVRTTQDREGRRRRRGVQIRRIRSGWLSGWPARNIH